MSIITHEELNEAVLDFNQRRKRAQTLRKFSKKISRARERARLRMADSEHLNNRAHKAATVIIRKIVAGKLGLDYSNLSVGQKMEIDRKVQRLSKLNTILTKRLLPKIRQAEILRLKQVHDHSGE